jgi:hypothetical protein
MIHYIMVKLTIIEWENLLQKVYDIDSKWCTYSYFIHNLCNTIISMGHLGKLSTLLERTRVQIFVIVKRTSLFSENMHYETKRATVLKPVKGKQQSDHQISTKRIVFNDNRFERNQTHNLKWPHGALLPSPRGWLYTVPISVKWK